MQTVNLKEAKFSKFKFDLDAFSDFDFAKNGQSFKFTQFVPTVFKNQLYLPGKVRSRGRWKHALAVFDLAQQKVVDLISLPEINGSIYKLKVNEWFIGITFFDSNFRLINRESNTIVGEFANVDSFGLNPHEPSMFIEHIKSNNTGYDFQVLNADPSLKLLKPVLVRKMRKSYGAKWHPTKSQLAMRINNEFSILNPDGSEIAKTNLYGSRNFAAVPDGWIVFGDFNWKKFGFDGLVSETFFPNQAGIEMSIRRDGLINGDSSKMRAVILEGNRFLTGTLLKRTEE